MYEAAENIVDNRLPEPVMRQLVDECALSLYSAGSTLGSDRASMATTSDRNTIVPDSEWLPPKLSRDSLKQLLVQATGGRDQRADWEFVESREALPLLGNYETTEQTIPSKQDQVDANFNGLAEVEVEREKYMDKRSPSAEFQESNVAADHGDMTVESVHASHSSLYSSRPSSGMSSGMSSGIMSVGSSRTSSRCRHRNAELKIGDRSPRRTDSKKVISLDNPTTSFPASLRSSTSSAMSSATTSSSGSTVQNIMELTEKLRELDRKTDLDIAEYNRIKMSLLGGLDSGDDSDSTIVESLNSLRRDAGNTSLRSHSSKTGYLKPEFSQSEAQRNQSAGSLAMNRPTKPGGGSLGDARSSHPAWHVSPAERGPSPGTYSPGQSAVGRSDSTSAASSQHFLDTGRLSLASMDQPRPSARRDSTVPSLPPVTLGLMSSTLSNSDIQFPLVSGSSALRFRRDLQSSRLSGRSSEDDDTD